MNRVKGLTKDNEVIIGILVDDFILNEDNVLIPIVKESIRENTFFSLHGIPLYIGDIITDGIVTGRIDRKSPNLNRIVARDILTNRIILKYDPQKENRGHELSEVNNYCKGFRKVKDCLEVYKETTKEKYESE